MHLFKESHLPSSILTLILYINDIIKTNSLTLERQKEVVECFFSTFVFLPFSEGIKFFLNTWYIVVDDAPVILNESPYFIIIFIY